MIADDVGSSLAQSIYFHVIPIITSFPLSYISKSLPYTYVQRERGLNETSDMSISTFLGPHVVLKISMYFRCFYA